MKTIGTDTGKMNSSKTLPGKGKSHIADPILHTLTDEKMNGTCPAIRQDDDPLTKAMVLTLAAAIAS